MTEYYFDMETTGIDFDKDEILTIHYQRLNGFTGEPMGKLEILKSWESSEKEVLETCAPNLSCRPFDFIFIGKNLLFDFCMLSHRMKHHSLGEIDLRCIYNRVSLDIKPILAIMNNGNFVGYDKVLPKTNPVRNEEVPQFLREGKYPQIIQYINDEAEDFTKAYHVFKRELPARASVPLIASSGRSRILRPSKPS
ncbi:MAG: hypothetical protein V1915_00110 [Candidatus Bathyarchaeota archaeon]